MTITATTETEDMVITYEAETERSDYGVPGSPVWDEIVNIEVIGVEILGVETNPKMLPKGLIAELRQMAPEYIESWS